MNVIEILKIWWPGLLVLTVLVSVWSYGRWVAHDAVADVKQDTKIEKLENDNANQRKDIETRKKQNEIITRDITPAAFDGILRRAEF